ncbi:ABC transporter ATP-binding protein, partial [Salmonella enterica subsp. enterica serovar Cerro]|nr:ABC transporter ATP-binding protein [Salmonella enterica subsp. enterica serovar Cerro]
LIVLFERKHFPFLTRCQRVWQLRDGALTPLC